MSLDKGKLLFKETKGNMWEVSFVQGMSEGSLPRSFKATPQSCQVMLGRGVKRLSDTIQNESWVTWKPLWWTWKPWGHDIFPSLLLVKSHPLLKHSSSGGLELFPLQPAAGLRPLLLKGECLPHPLWPLVTRERVLRPVASLDLILAHKKELVP